MNIIFIRYVSLQKNEDTEDLIRLDSSSSDMDDFDPLKSSSVQLRKDMSERQNPLSVVNPLYNYSNYNAQSNGSTLAASARSSSDRETVDLLQEYGLDFSSFLSTNFDPFDNSTNSTKVSSQKQWTKFE